MLGSLRRASLVVAVLLFGCLACSIAPASADDFASYLQSSADAFAVDTQFETLAAVPAVDPAPVLPEESEIAMTKTVSLTTTTDHDCAAGDHCALPGSTTYSAFRVRYRARAYADRPFGLFQNRPVRSALGRIGAFIFRGRLAGGC